ncbi:protein windbeutel [Phthorimaea operculella]|nr:protein windbeutel [Phthorimaea operculella]
MQRFLIFVCVALSAPNAFATKGLVELDEHSFEKLLNKFDAALVKFDVAYPYGDKHEAYSALAMEAKDVDELLVADVNVKDYGEKDNEALALKYGASKDNFPLVKLFLKGKSDPIPFDDSKGFTTETLRAFVREKSGLYLSLPGCVRQLDLLAAKFMQSGEADRKKVLKEVESEQKKLAGKHATSGKVYKTIMEKVLDKGDSFIKTETDRVKKILSGKISEEKKKEINTRLNILQNFETALNKNKNKEDL